MWSAADSGTRTFDSSSPEAHAVAIQNIKPKHPIAKDFLAELKKYGYKESDLDLNNITRTILVKSSAVSLSVPSKTGEMIMAYLFEKTYCVIKGVQNGDVVTYSTADGVSFASFERKDDSTTMISKTENKELEEFSAVLNKGEAKDGSGVATRAGCCRQESSWGDCMTCTHGSMGILGYAMMAYFVEFEIAVMGSCLGAGPGAWC